MKFEDWIVLEDNHLLIVDKPSGVLVQGDSTGDMSLVDYAKYYLKRRYGKPGRVFLGLPHRLDRPVGGLVVLCKTSKALGRMARMFREREIEKFYLAVVHGRVEEISGVLVDYVAQNRRGKKSFVCGLGASAAQRAELEYRRERYESGYSLLSIRLATGRKHQIRVQLSHIGHPIVGDLKYGSSVRLGHRICLQAHRLCFEHPVRRELIDIALAMPVEAEWAVFSG